MLLLPSIQEELGHSTLPCPRGHFQGLPQCQECSVRGGEEHDRKRRLGLICTVLPPWGAWTAPSSLQDLHPML